MCITNNVCIVSLHSLSKTFLHLHNVCSMALISNTASVDLPHVYACNSIVVTVCIVCRWHSVEEKAAGCDRDCFREHINAVIQKKKTQSALQLALLLNT